MRSEFFGPLEPIDDRSELGDRSGVEQVDGRTRENDPPTSGPSASTVNCLGCWGASAMTRISTSGALRPLELGDLRAGGIYKLGVGVGMPAKPPAAFDRFGE